MENTHCSYWIFKLVLLFCTLSCFDACLPGWEQGPSSKCYFFSRFAGTWAEANSVCMNFDSKLAEPVDELDFKFLSEGDLDRNPANGQYFIGGSDMFVEGNWVWSSNSQPVYSTHWLPGQPSDDGGNGDCLTILHGAFNDVSCGGHYAFICEQSVVDGQQIFG